ncbi:MAG: glycoside hydrolase family 172 protein [Pirellulales bacterium]
MMDSRKRCNPNFGMLLASLLAWSGFLTGPVARAQSPGGGASPGLLAPLTQSRPGRSQRASSSDANLDANGDSKTIYPGQTLVLADLDGPGAITHFWNTTASINPFSGRALVLRIYWDGAARPSVEVPLGDFFGVGHGAKATFQSLPVGVSSKGRSRSCYWRMPFRKHAKVTVTSERMEFGPVPFYYYLDWEKLDQLPDETLYFHARYRQQHPAQPGDHLLLETTGRGHYVGTVYSAHQTRNGWFGEGDDRFFIDGEQTPSIRGTGTEDYFGDAWGFREFAGPFHGVTLYEGPLAGDRVTAYRWHINDPVRFTKSLKVSIEHRGSVYTDEGKQISSSDQRPDWISSVAFWYQTPATTWEERLPPAKDRTAPYRIVPAMAMKIRATPEKIEKALTGVTFRPGTPDGEIELDFQIPESGRYKLSAVLLDSIFGSRYQPALDDEPLGPILNMNSKGADWDEYVFGLHSLKQGNHTFKLSGRGASPTHRRLGTPQYAVGISSLILLRMEDMEGYESSRATPASKEKRP